MSTTSSQNDIPISAEEMEQYPGILLPAGIGHNPGKPILEKLADAARGEYVCTNPVTVSEDCLRNIAEVNFRRAAEQERERCAKVAEAFDCEETSRCRCNRDIAAAIRRGE